MGIKENDTYTTHANIHRNKGRVVGTLRQWAINGANNLLNQPSEPEVQKENSFSGRRSGRGTPITLRQG